MNGRGSNSEVLYSKTDHKRVHSLLTVQMVFLTTIGQRPYIIEEWFPRKLRGLGWVLSYLYSGFVVMQTLHTTLLFLKTSWDMLHHGDINTITDALNQVTLCSFACFVACYWLWNMKVLKKFVAFINSNYWHHSLAGLTYVSSFDVYMKARRFTIYWLMSIIVAVLFWGIAPLLQGTRTLPLKCWYPFDPLQSRIYPVIYVWQLLTQINIGITYGCGSALYVSLIVLMLGQLDVLFCSLKNLQYHAQLLCGEDLETLRKLQQNLRPQEDDEINQYMFSHEQLTDLSIFREMSENLASERCHLQATLHESLEKCVQLHKFICECCRMLEDFYSPYCLVRSLQLSVQLCLMVFVGVAGERTVLHLVSLFQYLALTFTALVFYTYFGELLLQHSARCGDAFWRSGWESYATLIRKDIMIFLINSQRPVKLTAGKFFIMGTDRLRSVVMQAFSFLTLLQTLAANNN